MLDRLRWSLSQCQISSNCLHFIHCLRLLYHDICISCLVHVHDMCTICQLFLHAGFSHLCWLHYMFIHWVLSVVCNCFVWFTYTSIFEDIHCMCLCMIVTVLSWLHPHVHMNFKKKFFGIKVGLQYIHWFCSRSVTVSVFLQNADWVDYDEPASQPVGVYNIEHKFVVVK